MTENQPEPSHQDPAEPKEVDTEVETSDQPEPETQEEPDAVEVSPSNPEAKQQNLLGKDYEVTPERGFRRS